MGSVSSYGLKSRRPANASIVTSSGEVTNACVSGLPSLRFAKFRLYDVTMVFFTPGGIRRFHWPMHGPQAFANTVAPARSNTSTNPSFSMFTCRRASRA